MNGRHVGSRAWLIVAVIVVLLAIMAYAGGFFGRSGIETAPPPAAPPSPGPTEPPAP